MKQEKLCGLLYSKFEKNHYGRIYPVIAMLHLKGNGSEKLERARKEIEIYKNAGVDAVLVENYFGSTQDCINTLDMLKREYSDIKYGVNILGNWKESFRLAKEYNATFIQIDSVCGHLTPQEDMEYAEELIEYKRIFPDICVLGGVRFKYQPVLSGRSLEEDLQLGMQRCDAIVATGDGTGVDSPNRKLVTFKNILGDFPLIVGAGVTEQTIYEKFNFTDGAIVGIWFKEKHEASGEVCSKYVEKFMRVISDLCIMHRNTPLHEKAAEKALRWLEGYQRNEYGMRQGPVTWTLDLISSYWRVAEIDLSYFKEERPLIAFLDGNSEIAYLLNAELEGETIWNDRKVILFRLNTRASQGFARIGTNLEKNYTLLIWHVKSDGTWDILMNYEDC